MHATSRLHSTSVRRVREPRSWFWRCWLSRSAVRPRGPRPSTWAALKSTQHHLLRPRHADGQRQQARPVHPVVAGRQTLPLLIWSSGSAWLSDNGRVERLRSRRSSTRTATPWPASAFAPAPRRSSRDSCTTSARRSAGSASTPRTTTWTRPGSPSWATRRAAGSHRSQARPATSLSCQGSLTFAGSPAQCRQRCRSSPTDFLQMDAWYVAHPEVVSFIRHDALAPLAPP